VFVTHEHLIVVLDLAPPQSMASREVHECTTMNCDTKLSLIRALPQASVMVSADGSWRFALMNIPLIVAISCTIKQSCQQMVHGKFALRTSGRSLFSLSACRQASHVSRGFMSRTHEHLLIKLL
jgi:hypothetical protein